MNPEQVVLHYLNGKVHVDIFLPVGTAGSGDVSTAIRAAAQQAEDIGDVRIFYQ
jgi:hypothetical protein